MQPSVCSVRGRARFAVLVFNEGFSKVMHVMRLYKKYIKRTIKVDINGQPRGFKTDHKGGTNKQIDDNDEELRKWHLKINTVKNLKLC